MAAITSGSKIQIQKMQNPNRKLHVGKSTAEKEAYKNFLSQRFKLDKTEEDEENPAKTNASTFDADASPDMVTPQKKSLRLKVKDFLESNWTITIVGGVIVLMIAGAFNVVMRQSVQSEKISNLEKRTDGLDQKIGILSSGVDGLNRALEVMKAEVGKDIEFLKNGLRLK